MRIIIIPLCLLSANAMRVCDSEEKDRNAAAAVSAEVNAETKGGTSAKAAMTAPRIGGSVTAVGDFAVEVQLHQSGLVEALVSDAQGKLVTDAKLSVEAQAKAGKSATIALGFVPARGRFEGRAATGVELASGPVNVSLDVGGKAASAKFAGIVVPRAALGGAVLVAGGYSAEMFVRPTGEVQAFVRDGAGLSVGADAKADFKARLKTKAGGSEEISLKFDPARACFAGKAKAGVELVPGPLEFVVNAGGSISVGRLEGISLVAEATHGGQIVVAGDYSLELVANGPELKAFVFDARGKALTRADLDLKVDVGAGAASKLGLKWDAGCLCYQGRVDGNVDLSLEPLRVMLVASGKAFVAAVSSLKASADARIDVNAKLNGKAKAGLDANAAAEVKGKLDPKINVSAPNVKASARAAADKAVGAAAKVNVTPPKIDVKVNKSASASTGTKAGGGAKASAGFSFGTK